MLTFHNRNKIISLGLEPYLEKQVRNIFLILLAFRTRSLLPKVGKAGLKVTTAL